MEKFAIARLVFGSAFMALSGAWLYRVNLHTDDTGILAGLILINSAVVAFIVPRRWWPAATLIGVCVVASEFQRSGETLGPHIGLVAAFVMVISILGAGAGAAAQWLIRTGGLSGHVK